MQRYVKFNHGSECPNNIACIYASWTRQTIDEQRGVRLDRTHTIAGYSARWERGKWGREKPLLTQSLADLWEWLYSLTRRKSTLWIFGHGLTQQAELLGILEQIEGCGLRWQESYLNDHGETETKRYGVCVPDGHPWLFKGVYRFRSVRITDICNYVSKTLPEFAESLGYLCVKGKPLPLEQFSADGRAVHSARIIYEWIMHAIDLWRSEDIGTWQQTAAKLAMNAYMHSEKKLYDTLVTKSGSKADRQLAAFRKASICTHDYPDVKKLEREAYHAGQAEAYYLGNYDQSVHYIDVRAMYPYLATITPLPVRYYRSLGPCNPRLLRTMLEPWIGLASVTIAGPDSLYPCKVYPEKPVRIISRDSGASVGEHFQGPLTIYPEGRYCTVLCGDELLAALDAGHVQEVHQAHLYQSGSPLSDFMHSWWERRINPDMETDDVWQDLCKLVMNGLIGKFGQRSQVWEDEPNMMPPRAWQQFYAGIAGTDKSVRYRSIGYQCQRYMGKRELEHSAIAIPACITAAGRVLMRKLRESIGDGRVLLQDTDGLIVTDAGLIVARSLQNFGKLEMGALRLDDSAPSIEILGPRHYRWGEQWVMAGLERGWEWARNGTMQAWLSDWLYSRILGLTAGQFAAKLKPWDMGKGHMGRTRLADGWTAPLLVGF